ncbi:PASTA domain-containing protein [Flavobacteriaceae bacterium Ap0902]|nr:PASTA domain-containing protein [Flavobacteriaceae bacterium Ap0902]
MKFLKAFISWKLWLAILLGIGLIILLWNFSFKYLDTYTNHGVEVEVPDLSGIPVQEAIKVLEEKELNYEVDSVKFTEDYPPYAILDFYPKAGSKVKPGRRVFIKSNPRTWAPVEIPNLVNKSMRLANTQLIMRGFVVGDTIYVKDRAKDAVLAVLYNGDTIQTGALLPKGARVDLVLGRGLNYDVPVPNLLGFTLKETKDIIDNQYFEVGQIYFLDSRDSIDTKVIYQDPPVGDIYDEGLPISIWLSSKSREENKTILDSLDIRFRRVALQDSVYTRAVESSRTIDISDLPEDIRNQIKYDQNSDPNMRPTQPNPRNNQSKIDTTGISID